MFRLSFTVTVVATLFASQAVAQQSLTIGQAIQKALDQYPAVAASVEQVSSASAGIDLARTSYLPRADFLGQVNRATRNNVLGLLFPQAVIPSVSGPVLGRDESANVWGSAVGTLISWEPFDFGLRRANVRLAESVRDTKAAFLDVTRLQVQATAADAFLTILASQQTVLAAKAGVDRSRAFLQVVESLVTNQLRPGADASRARAELAAAENQLIQAEEANEVARASLGQLLGIAPSAVVLEAGSLLQLPSESSNPETDLTRHPAAIEQSAIVQQAQARLKVLDCSYSPTFSLQAAAYGRGTGARTDGSVGGGASGLAPNTGNWAFGLTVTFPALSLPSIHAREDVELHAERAEAARYEKMLRDLDGQLEVARARVRGARRIAENTPVQLEAAKAAESQAAARYRSGLTTILEVADAQRLLTQAEIDNSLAMLNVWRALLVEAVAEGNLDSFLSLTGR